MPRDHGWCHLETFSQRNLGYKYPRKLTLRGVKYLGVNLKCEFIKDLRDVLVFSQIENGLYGRNVLAVEIDNNSWTTILG